MTQPPLLLDAEVMGLLRKYLVETYGPHAARTILTQLGVAQGRRLADAMQDDFGRRRPLSREGVVVAASYEAEQHLLHFGRATTSVCWTLCGLTSGYLSRSDREEIVVLEDRCAGKGDAACHLVGRTREEWGAERSEDLAFFDPARLAALIDASKTPFAKALKSSDRSVRSRRGVRVRTVPEVEDPHAIVARSPTMRALLDLTRRVGRIDSPVVITGATGTGKARIGRLVHEASARSGRPFVTIHCAARPEAVLETELFGHAEGSSADATHDRPGAFEAAHTGTLVLDEVADFSNALQVKLLHAMQEHAIRRVGEDHPRPVDVRVIAANREDLAHAVAGGRFRQDLFYKLNVVALHVPALRDRHDDILPLARALLATAGRRLNRRVPTLTPETTDALLRYGWPGNVRELEAAMDRAGASAHGGRVVPEDLPEEIRPPQGPSSAVPIAVRPLMDVERDYILAALKINDGNQTRTATQLRIGSATLYRKLKSYGLVSRRPAGAKVPHPAR